MRKQYFGTDGIRGRVGEHPVTPEFVLKLGWAAGRVFAERAAQRSEDAATGRILIGKDTRISGYMFESALEAGLSAAGVDVSLLGPMPTPAIAYLTRTFRGLAGIVISASHNPYYDNGIKFFSAFGEKLDDETELAIEARLAEPMVMAGSDAIGKVSRLTDAAGRYIEFCKSCYDGARSLHGLRMVVDCAHGATYHVAPNVFEELGAEVVVLGCAPNGRNINEEAGSTHPAVLADAVREHGADLGIAFDGDGDRVVMVDECGEVVDGDELLFVIARDRQARGVLQGGVVGTQMTNFGAEVALAELGVPFVRAAVGDRHVMAELVERQWQLGGEGSGHIICLDRTSTGDGLVSALQVLSVLVREGVGLHELKGGMTKYPQTMINVRWQERHGDPLAHADVREAVDEAETALDNGGRVLLRPSGTEPVVRVMVEGADREQVESLARRLAERVQGSA